MSIRVGIKNEFSFEISKFTMKDIDNLLPLLSDEVKEIIEIVESFQDAGLDGEIKFEEITNPDQRWVEFIAFTLPLNEESKDGFDIFIRENLKRNRYSPMFAMRLSAILEEFMDQRGKEYPFKVSEMKVRNRLIIRKDFEVIILIGGWTVNALTAYEDEIKNEILIRVNQLEKDRAVLKEIKNKLDDINNKIKSLELANLKSFELKQKRLTENRELYQFLLKKKEWREKRLDLNRNFSVKMRHNNQEWEKINSEIKNYEGIFKKELIEKVREGIFPIKDEIKILLKDIKLFDNEIEKIDETKQLLANFDEIMDRFMVFQMRVESIQSFRENLREIVFGEGYSSILSESDFKVFEKSWCKDTRKTEKINRKYDTVCKKIETLSKFKK